MKTISISTATFAALWAARKEGEETEDAILTRLLASQSAGAPAPAKRAQAGLTPQQKAAMQKQKMIKPVPPAPAKAKEAEAKKPCGPKLSTTDLDLLS
ncbi:MAG: hypothetical protein HKN05_10895 [Rhizobiales bacterium]|nr:hypothetical protein [Hyphomicrobiales bacterium]